MVKFNIGQLSNRRTTDREKKWTEEMLPSASSWIIWDRSRRWSFIRRSWRQSCNENEILVIEKMTSFDWSKILQYLGVLPFARCDLYSLFYSLPFDGLIHSFVQSLTAAGRYENIQSTRMTIPLGRILFSSIISGWLTHSLTEFWPYSSMPIDVELSPSW